MKHWTPDDDAILTDLYHTLSAGEIGKIMGRTRTSIKGRVNVLGLKKPEGATNSGRFVAGGTSWNKGKQFDSGGRSHETRFKPAPEPAPQAMPRDGLTVVRDDRNGKTTVEQRGSMTITRHTAR